jgi:hypothetical protein
MLPTLVVEGKEDYRILQKRWCSGPKNLRMQIQIQYPTGELSKQGVLEELRKRSGDPTCYGLVDMDHDFKGAEIEPHLRVYDTRPLVTFPSHAFRDKDAAIRVVKNIGGPEKFYDKATNIVRLAKTLTIIKLFKGMYRIESRSKLFAWSDVKIEILDEREFLHHVAKEFGIEPRHCEELDGFYSKFHDRIKICGYNDHMLLVAWETCFLDFYPTEQSKLYFYRKQFRDEILNRLTKKENHFIDNLKHRIQNHST